jgi:hypothetical protein
MTDRSYYRALPTVLLIEQALDSGHEMAIALGERLVEYDTNDDTIDDLLKENKELDRRNDALMARIAELEAQLDWAE